MSKSFMIGLLLTLAFVVTANTDLSARGGGGRGGELGGGMGGDFGRGGSNYGEDSRALDNRELQNDYNNLNSGGGYGYGQDYYDQEIAYPPAAPNPNAPFDPVPINLPGTPQS